MVKFFISKFCSINEHLDNNNLLISGHKFVYYPFINMISDKFAACWVNKSSWCFSRTEGYWCYHYRNPSSHTVLIFYYTHIDYDPLKVHFSYPSFSSIFPSSSSFFQHLDRIFRFFGTIIPIFCQNRCMITNIFLTTTLKIHLQVPLMYTIFSTFCSQV